MSRINMKTTIAALVLLAASTAFAQTPAFEVAVIKQASQANLMSATQAGQRPHVGITVDKNRVDIGFQSLSDILAFAYAIAPFQLVGPDYLKTEHFDILAKLPAGATEEQVPEMLQSLLAERFGLKMHREKKEAPIYALVVSKGGLKKMKPATADEIAPEPVEGDQTRSTPFGKMTIREIPGKGVVGFMPGIGTLKVSAAPNGEHIEMSNLTTSHFAKMMMTDLDRVVVDKTGLNGSYEASFDISMDTQGLQAQAPGADSGGPGGAASAPPRNQMFQAVEQLGLKLEPQKDLVDTIVIDHIEKAPTEN
jgi:uncharacterized protein (TIGR03435 family)